MDPILFSGFEFMKIEGGGRKIGLAKTLGKCFECTRLGNRTIFPQEGCRLGGGLIGTSEPALLPSSQPSPECEGAVDIGPFAPKQWSFFSDHP